MSLRLDAYDQAAEGTVSTRNLLEPLFKKTFYLGIFVPLHFMYFGSSASDVRQSRWLAQEVSVIWPALPSQYELVLQEHGSGHAASFGFMSAGLSVWPVVCAVMFLRKQAERRSQVFPASIKDVCNPLFAFHANAYGLFPSAAVVSDQPDSPRVGN